MPKVSIAAVIPLFNGAEFIERALRSALVQTRMPDEILVVDDGSSDDGPEIVKTMIRNSEKITFLSKPNGGQGSARNLAIRSTNCELIAFLDQDDVWYPPHLEVLAKPFEEETSVRLGWVTTNMDLIDSADQILHRSYLNIISAIHPKRNFKDCLSQNMFVVPSATLASRAAIMEVGGFDERLRGYEDDDLFFRIFAAGYDNIYLNKTLTRWRVHPTSSSRQGTMDRSAAIYCEKLLKAYPDQPEIGVFIARDLVKPRFGLVFFDRYKRAIREGDLKSARRYADDLALFLPSMVLRRARRLRLILAIMRSRVAPFVWPLIQPVARQIIKSL